MDIFLLLFYPPEPDRKVLIKPAKLARRSSIQAARLDVIAGVMVCPRDEVLQMKLRPENDTSQISV